MENAEKSGLTANKGDLLAILKLPGRKAKALAKLYEGRNPTQDEVNRAEQEQTEAEAVAALLIDVVSNPEHPLFWPWFGTCPIKSTTRMSRNGLLLALRYVEGMDWPDVRDMMANFGHRTSLRNIKRWHSGALKDLAILEKRFRLPADWEETVRRETERREKGEAEGGGTE